VPLPLVAVLLLVPPARAQEVPAGEVEERVYRLLHQAAGEAVALVAPLLSEAGSVELRPGGNSLVIRDRPPALARIVALLADFDQPARWLLLRVQIVAAEAEDAAAGEGGSGLPEELVQRLRELLRYRSYRRVAGASLEVAEGNEVSRQLDGEYRVDFRMGRLEADRRIRLLGFRVFRRRGAEPAQLVHTNINLRLGKPMVLGLARTEASDRALMVVLDCDEAAAPEAAGDQG